MTKQYRGQMLHKLMLYGVNELVKRDLIDLELTPETEACCFDVDKASMPKEKGWADIDICGRPSLIHWRNVGYGELQISVWFDVDRNALDASLERYGGTIPILLPMAHPQHLLRSLKPYVAGIATGWLERKTGKYIMTRKDGGISLGYIRDSSRQQIQDLPTPEPIGYRAKGKML